MTTRTPRGAFRSNSSGALAIMISTVGAAQSIDSRKRARIAAAARQFLARFPREPACRFDVVTLDGGAPQWLRGAFELA